MRYVILDNIRSAHNVGSIFRTCEGAGIDKIFLGGYTPAPVDRFGRVVAEIAKTSLGASELVPWEKVEDVLTLIKQIKKNNFTIVVVEQTLRSVSFQSVKVPTNSAFVFGNEVSGVQSAVCAEADMLIDIPMHGIKESLNVSVSVGVVLFGTCNQS